MRRDYFDANVDTERGESALPVISLSFDGPEGLLSERLTTEDGPLDASEIDVTYRLTTAAASEANGVLSLANRLTGEFLLEANVDPDVVDRLVRAGQEADGDEDSSYRVRLVDRDETTTVYDKETLLVYDANGSLLRQRSLIPGGVEL